MCDQTELPYNPGDIVWVKLGPVWWPGQVQDYDKLPEEITSNLRKKPIAVVKFFQEESFEYVKNINHIYHYNCRKKHEFIKKGLDLCRSAVTRDVPSNMHLFPNDIATAEHLTGGNPNIIKDDEFAPEEKPDYSELFGTKKSPGKKLKSDSTKKEYIGCRLKRVKESLLKNGRRSLPTIPTRAITHPRFINKAFHGQSDHEVRIRHQITTPLREDDPVLSSPQKQYNCHVCGFTSSRLNVIVLHNKSHSAGFSDTYLATSASQLKRPKVKDYSVSPAFKSRVKSTPRRLLLGADTPKRKKERSPKEAAEQSEEGPVTSTPRKERVVEEKTLKKPEFGKRKSVKDKKQSVKQKIENVAIRETLLKDWDEDDDLQEEAEMEQIKQIKDKPCDDEEEKQDADKVGPVKAGGQPRLLSKRSLRIGKSLGKVKEESSKGKETSCFDFDDSDEGIRLDGTVMKFGMKIPRVLNEEKTKRKSVDVETAAELTGTIRDDVKKLEEEIKKAEEEKQLESEFESLLEETAVPVIPDVPKNGPASNTFDCVSVSAMEDTRTSGADEVVISADVTDNKNTAEHKLESDSLKELKSEHDFETIESNPVCNIAEVGSINNKDFDEIAKKTEPASAEPVSSSVNETPVTSIESTDIESNVESSVIKQQTDSEFEINEIVSSSKIDTEVVQQNESDFIELSSVGPPPDYTVNESEEIVKAENKTTIEHNETIEELIIHQSTNDQQKADDAVQPNIEIHKEEFIEQFTADPNFTKLQPKIETEDIQHEVTSSRLDFQQIVNDVYIEETISQQNVENESKVEIISDPPLPHIIETKLIPEQKEIELKSDPVEPTLQNVTASDKFQDIPFDINSMPVIIGEDLIQPAETKPLVLSPNKVIATDSLMQSTNKNVIMISNQSTSGKNEQGGSKVLQSVISVAGKDGQIITGKTLGQKQLTTVKTIQLPPGSPLPKLKSVSGLTKSGSNQVLILKTAGGQTSKIAVNKSNLQKFGQQSGGKVLILTNPQTNQGKVATLTSQQVLTSGGKLLPGTRLITSKGTVLTTSGAQTVTLSKNTVQKAGTKAGQKYVISKGNILTTTSKNMMIGKSGILTPITSTTTKGQTFITQNVVTSKGSLIIPSSSAISKPPSVVPQTITTSKGMILTMTPMTSKGIISGNQKVRIVSSTAPRLVVQNPQSKIVTIPQQKNQKVKIVSTKTQPSSTLLIQTSGQPAILTSTNQITTKPKLIPVSSALPVTSQIVPRLTVPQTQPQIIKKVQKVRQASPNILQKSQKKPTPRAQKSLSNRLITPTITSPAQETILLSPTGIPVVETSNIIKAGLPQGEGTALVYLTVDEAGNYRPLADSSLVSFDGAQQDSRTLYIDSNTTDMDNIFLTIDDAGNVVNISQPAPPTYTSESTLPSQDILAKALANTQVLQQETIIPDAVPSSMVSSSLDHPSTLNSSFAEQAHYPQPSLSHSVLETSLTLNQPIMTPLEVPSAVTSSMSQISSLPSSFIHSITNPKTLIRPSMPLLTEDSDQQQPEPVYLLDSAHNIITPVTSSGQLSLQLLNDNVIVSQGTSLIPSTYQVVTTNVLTSPVFTENTDFKTESDAALNITSPVQPQFIIRTDQNETILPEYSQEHPSDSHITTDFLNDVELKQNETETETKSNIITNVENTEQYLTNEKPLRKRSMEGGCDMNTDMQDSPKRLKIEER